MFVSPVPSRSSARQRFRLPPAAFGAVAVLLSAFAAMAQAPAAKPEAAPSTPTTAPAVKDDVSLWELHNKGGPVMLVLDACSVLAVAIILERLISLRRSRIIPPTFLAGLRAQFGGRVPPSRVNQAVQYAEADGSPFGRMIAAYYRRFDRGIAAAEGGLEEAGAIEAMKLRAYMRVFYAIGSIATLLGLIGTIAGMIKAFRVTAQAGDAANKVELLSTGIYEAMVCTFGGLAVAILVTAFYYFFIGRIERLITDLNEEVARFADEFGGEAPAAASSPAVLPLAPPAPPVAPPALA